MFVRGNACCLIFLLLQKHIFGSYDWEHIVAEVRSQAKRASQSAMLFNEIVQDREDQTVAKVRRSLNRIKKQQSGNISRAAAARVDTSELLEGLSRRDENEVMTSVPSF